VSSLRTTSPRIRPHQRFEHPGSRFFIGQRHAIDFPLEMLQVREDTTMNQQTMKYAIAVALFGAAMLGSVLPSGAAPISPSTTLLTQAASSSGVTEIYYRRHYRGRGYYGAPGAAIGLGILGAAAGAAAYGAYGGSYYGPRYYAPGYYGGPYPYRRQYYAPY